MTKLPVVSGEQVIKALKRAGFYVHHQKVAMPCSSACCSASSSFRETDTGLTVEEFVGV